MRKLLLALAILGAGPTTAQDQVAPAGVARHAIEDFVRPAFTDAAQQALELEGGLLGFCANASDFGLDLVRGMFAESVTAYARVSWLRFGPLAADNRAEKLLLWPDPRGIALKQVQAALAEQDATATDPTLLTNKSVALRGFPALEFVLFGTGSEALAKGDAFRCDFAHAIASVIGAELLAIANEWAATDAGTISDRLINPSTSDVDYRSTREVLEELVGAAAHGIEAIRDTQMLPFLGRTRFNPKPRSALFWRSGQSFAAIGAAFAGIEQFVDASRLGDAVGDNQWLATGLAFDFDQARDTVARLTLPVDEALQDPAHVRDLNDLLIINRDLQGLLGDALPRLLGLSVGFSALDGD